MHISEIVFKRKPLFYFVLFSIVVGGILSFIKISKLELNAFIEQAEVNYHLKGKKL
jgi:hypothetical protein